MSINSCFFIIIMILLNQYMVGDKVDILKEYGSFFVDLFKRVIELDIIYIILIIVLIIGVSILLSFATKKALEEMNIKVNGVVWVPFINILYFFTKAIHSLMAIVFCLLVLLIIPIPHPVHGIFTISSLVSNKMCHIIYVALSLELIVGIVVFIIKYIRFDKSIRFVK